MIVTNFEAFSVTHCIMMSHVISLDFLLIPWNAFKLICNALAVGYCGLKCLLCLYQFSFLFLKQSNLMLRSHKSHFNNAFRIKQRLKFVGEDNVVIFKIVKEFLKLLGTILKLLH